jgi:hypothetical protein
VGHRTTDSIPPQYDNFIVLLVPMGTFYPASATRLFALSITSNRNMADAFRIPVPQPIRMSYRMLVEKVPSLVSLNSL